MLYIDMTANTDENTPVLLKQRPKKKEKQLILLYI